MKLVTWLRTLLPRPAPAAASYQQPAASTSRATYSGPLVPVPPLSAAQRAARAQAREPATLAAVAEAQALAQAQGILAELHPTSYRLLVERKYVEADLLEAQAMSWVVDELHLRVELQRLEAEILLRAWQQSLVQRYGPELGARLGQHEVAVGMRWEHLVVCYGQPATGAMQRLAGHPNRWGVQYGRPATGSYFELTNDVVTVARLGLPTLPAHLAAVVDIK